MKKYSVSIPWHCEIIVKVEAKNKAIALAKAYENANTHLCYFCSKHIQMSEQNTDCLPDIQELKDSAQVGE